MNRLVLPCCLACFLGKIKCLGYSGDPYSLSRKDVSLSFLKSDLVHVVSIRLLYSLEVRSYIEPITPSLY